MQRPLLRERTEGVVYAVGMPFITRRHCNKEKIVL